MKKEKLVQIRDVELGKLYKLKTKTILRFSKYEICDGDLFVFTALKLCEPTIKANIYCVTKNIMIKTQPLFAFNDHYSFIEM